MTFWIFLESFVTPFSLISLMWTLFLCIWLVWLRIDHHNTFSEKQLFVLLIHYIVLYASISLISALNFISCHRLHLSVTFFSALSLSLGYLFVISIIKS